MASTVYYGISQTEATEQVKQVVLKNVEELPTFKSGDILSVYFAFRNDHNGVALAVYIGDSEQEGSTSNANGNTIFNTANIAVGPCDWKDGEVVLFSYTKNENTTENPNAVAYWEMVSKAHAKDDVYGDVLLEDDQLNNNGVDGWDADHDDAVATIGLIKKHMIQEWQYTDETSSPHTEVGYFYTLDNSTEPPTEDVKATIYIPEFPTDLGDFTNGPGYIKNPIEVDLIFTGSEDNNWSKDLQIQNENDEEPRTIIDLDNYEGQVGIYGDTYIYGNIYADNLDLNGRILTDEIHAHTEDGTIQVTSPINIGNTIDLGNDVYVNTIPLDEYIKDILDSEDDGIQSKVDSEIAGLLADYMITKRYYASVPTGLTRGAIKMIAYGVGATEERTDVDETIKTNESLHIPGYDVVGIIAWEAWHGPSSNTNPKNVNIFGIWWQGNDPQSEVVYLKTTALDGDTPAFRTSVDILYKKSTYMISYNAMGGEGTPEPQYKLYNQTIRLSKDVPTRSGASFEGWRTNPNSSKIAYQPNDLYTANENCTLYATWSDDGGQLVYDNQGLGMSIRNVTMRYEDVVRAHQAPRGATFSHTFNEWNTDPYGNGTIYMPGDVIKEANQSAFDLTLYAIWDKKILTYDSGYYEYDVSGGDNPSELGLYEYRELSGVAQRSGYVLTTDTQADQEKTYYKKTTATLYMTYLPETRASSNILVRDGYMISGWNTRSDGSGITYGINRVIKEARTIPESNLILYAIWDTEKTITYNSNFNDQNVPDIEVSMVLTFDDAALAYYDGFEKEGYHIDHWNTESDDSGTSYAVGDIVKPANQLPTDSITLYAHWAENPIEPENNGGEGE